MLIDLNFYTKNKMKYVNLINNLQKNITIYYSLMSIYD